MPTRLDVAKMAGVSQSTVSRVLNESGYVSRDVRIRVEQAISDLNYVPNRLARGLRLQECKQIVCITPSISNMFYSEVVAGIEETTLEHGYTFSLYNITYEKREYLKVVLEGFYDGLIILSPVEVKKIMDLDEISKYLPTSLYWDQDERPAIPHVYVDLRKAMKDAVTYLIEQGHKDIIFLGYQFESQLENPRYQGYIDAMKGNGLPILPYYTQFMEQLNDTLTTGYQKIKEFVNQDLPFSAIVAANDLMAVGAMRALTESGKRVPQDISVLGVDDIELSSIVSPALTTVHIPKRKIGNTLAKQLLAQINGNKEMTASVVYPTQLMIRESVMPR
jgi:DNA-binding LacI/PurR family transcriptional regulator